MPTNQKLIEQAKQLACKRQSQTMGGRYIQELSGRSPSKTTEIYTYLNNRASQNIKTHLMTLNYKIPKAHITPGWETSVTLITHTN